MILPARRGGFAGMLAAISMAVVGVGAGSSRAEREPPPPPPRGDEGSWSSVRFAIDGRELAAREAREAAAAKRARKAAKRLAERRS